MNKTLKYALIGLGAVTLIGAVYAIYKRATKTQDNRGSQNGNGLGGGIFGGGSGGSSTSVIGKSVYILPSERYTNVRTSAKIDNIPPDNILARYWKNADDIPSKWNILYADMAFDKNIAIGEAPIGKIISTSEEGDGTWYKVVLVPGMSGTNGYVREDAVKLG